MFAKVLSFIKQRLNWRVVLVIVAALAVDTYHRSAVQSAFERGYETAQNEARTNDAERAAQIREKARASGFSIGTPVARDAPVGLLRPTPGDTRGYRD